MLQFALPTRRRFLQRLCRQHGVRCAGLRFPSVLCPYADADLLLLDGLLDFYLSDWLDDHGVQCEA